MRKIAFALLSLCLFAALAGLAAAQPRVGPPPPRLETPTLRPSPGHVWATGYWKWTGFNYEWLDGRWIKAKKNRVWVDGSWQQVGNRWVWKAGKWVKPQKLAPKPKPKAKGKPGK